MCMQGVDRFVAVLDHLLASNYILLSGIVIWFYDILVTLGDELSLLWTRGGRLIKILYLLNRYLPFIGLYLALQNNNPSQAALVSDQRCRIQFLLVISCQAIGVIVATTIFVFRLYALFCFNRGIRILLVVILLASHICVLAFAVLLCHGAIKGMAYSPSLHCCISKPPKLPGGFYAAPIFIESIVALATLYHAWRYRDTKMQSHSVKAIISSLYLDEFFYYALVLTLRLTTCLLYWIAPQSLSFPISSFEYAFISTITSRWFLSFRKVLTLSDNLDDTFLPTVTGLQIFSVEHTSPAIEFTERSVDATSSIHDCDWKES
ncbi:hypothetical protein CPB86DRAFT_789269, partial [Serendipita vermifera]